MFMSVIIKHITYFRRIISSLFSFNYLPSHMLTGLGMQNFNSNMITWLV